MPPPHNRPTWDLTSVLYAVLGDRGYFDVSPRGRVTVESDGSTRFEENSQGSHAYLILRPEQKPRVLEALVQLSSQPPRLGSIEKQCTAIGKARRGFQLGSLAESAYASTPPPPLRKGGKLRRCHPLSPPCEGGVRGGARAQTILWSVLFCCLAA